MPDDKLITDHQFLRKYPIDKTATRLILGTIHPHFHEDFELQFFYGNEVSLWRIFHQAFPTELPDPRNLGQIRTFLVKRKLAISDTILKCERISPTALDDDLIVLKHNDRVLIEDIRRSTINEILCTSGFDKCNAFKIFYCDILGLSLTTEIRRNKVAQLPVSIFGRPVTIRSIYSPSSTANRGIGNSPAYKVVKNLMSTDDYRIKLYKEEYFS